MELFGTLPWPTFERETEYIALVQPNEYGFIDGEIGSTDGNKVAVNDYRNVTNEHLEPHATAKHARSTARVYMVGALARFNLKHEQLHPRAKAAAEHLGLKPPATGPIMNSAAQVVEIVHCVDDVICCSTR